MIQNIKTKLLKEKINSENRINIWKEIITESKNNEKLFIKNIKDFIIEYPFNNDNWKYFITFINNKLPYYEELLNFYCCYNIVDNNIENIFDTNNISLFEIKLYLDNKIYDINKGEIFFKLFNKLISLNDADFLNSLYIKIAEFPCIDINNTKLDSINILNKEEYNIIYLKRIYYESELDNNTSSKNNLNIFIEYINFISENISNINNFIFFIFKKYIIHFHKLNKFWKILLRILEQNNLKLYLKTILKQYRKYLYSDISVDYILKEYLLLEYDSDFNSLNIIENLIKPKLNDNFKLYSFYFERLIRSKNNEKLKLLVDKLPNTEYFPNEKAYIISRYVDYLKGINENYNDLIINILEYQIKNNEFNITLYHIYFYFIFENYNFDKTENNIKIQIKEMFNKANNNHRVFNNDTLKNMINNISRKYLTDIKYVLQIDNMIREY